MTRWSTHQNSGSLSWRHKSSTKGLRHNGMWPWHYHLKGKESMICNISKYCLVHLPLFSPLIVSNSSWPHGQHLSTSLRVCPSSCPLHQWCHPAISSSDVLLSFCPQSCLALGTSLPSFNQLCGFFLTFYLYWSIVNNVVIVSGKQKSN